MEHPVEVEIYQNIVPQTAENFLSLCQGLTNQSYTGNKVHRIIQGFCMQAGDIINQNGTSGKSIYGVRFKDEAAGLKLKHNTKGVLSMSNAGPNTNNSQFFITFNPAPFLDNRHVVFGKVVGDESFKMLDLIEAVGTPSDMYPLTSNVTIRKCELKPTTSIK